MNKKNNHAIVFFCFVFFICLITKQIRGDEFTLITSLIPKPLEKDLTQESPKIGVRSEIGALAVDFPNLLREVPKQQMQESLD